MKTIDRTSYPAFALIMLALLALLPPVQAVMPPPDGGYPGFNTAEGQNALFSLTTGGYNTAVGYFALSGNTADSFNTAVGAGALLANNVNPGAGFGENTAVGAGALLSNTTGLFNTANGALALFSNTTDGANTAVGCQALFSNVTGGNNTATGYQALYHSNGGTGNTAIGSQALLSNTTGQTNTAIGSGALVNETTGLGNTALGLGAGLGVTTANGVICIGETGNNVDNSCYIGRIFNATSSGGTAVYVNMNGRLGTATSSKRFKENIKPMGDGSEKLFSLKPVTFRYKKGIDPESPEHKSEFGLLAEDVETVIPDLVVRDKEGKPYSVRYDQVNAMLLNEFLKEHRAFLEEQRKVERLEKQVATLTAGLQKVSAQIATGSPSLADSSE